MRIGIDATALPASPAGAGRYIRGLISGLTTIDTPHEYVVFVKEADRSRFDHLHSASMTFSVIPWNSRPSRLLWEMFQTSEIIRKHRLDVWHAPHYIVPRKADGCRVVVTYHDMVFDLFPQLYSPVKGHLFRAAQSHAGRLAHHIIATSRATADEVNRILGWSPRNMTVIHPGVDDGFKPDTLRLPEVRRRYGLPSSYLLSVGTLDRRKNPQFLIQVYARLVQEQGLDYGLVLAGQPGNGMDQIRDEIRRWDMEDRVVLPGYVDEKDMPTLYSGACLFVSASLYEGFGFPALEALACGTPVLSSPSPSLREDVHENVIIAESFDAEQWNRRLIEALAMRPVGRLLPDDALYSWKSVAEQTVQVYEGAGATLTRRVYADAYSSATDTAVCREAVLKTMVYADLFDYPMTVEEIHYNLMGHTASQKQVEAALNGLMVRGVILRENRWFMLFDRSGLAEERKRRAENAEALFNRHQNALYWLCACPFVRMTALSGALAFYNCPARSDIDLFLIADSRRLWTTYAFLAFASKVFGMRDLLCLNYLIGRTDKPVPERDFFTASQLANLRPLYGWLHYRRFTISNAWVMGRLPQWNGHEEGAHRFPEIRLTRTVSRVKRFLEWALSFPLLRFVESGIFTLYRRRIQRKVTGKPSHGVRLTPDEIKLHTNDHSERLMALWEQRLAQVATRTGSPEQPSLMAVSYTAERSAV